MQLVSRFVLVAALFVSVACATGPKTNGVLTSASVSVSNGRTYTMETFFAAADRAAVRQTRQSGEVQTSVISGARAFTSASPNEDGGRMLRTIVLGHQFHALLLHFDAIHGNVRGGEVRYAGHRRVTSVGDWPYGGTSKLVRTASGSAEAFVFNYEGAPEIRVALSDWRDVGGGALPFRMAIDDGSNVYDYSFTAIETNATAPDWAG